MKKNIALLFAIYLALFAAPTVATASDFVIFGGSGGGGSSDTLNARAPGGNAGTIGGRGGDSDQGSPAGGGGGGEAAVRDGDSTIAADGAHSSNYNGGDGGGTRGGGGSTSLGAPGADGIDCGGGGGGFGGISDVNNTGGKGSTTGGGGGGCGNAGTAAPTGGGAAFTLSVAPLLSQYDKISVEGGNGGAGGHALGGYYGGGGGAGGGAELSADLFGASGLTAVDIAILAGYGGNGGSTRTNNPAPGSGGHGGNGGGASFDFAGKAVTATGTFSMTSGTDGMDGTGDGTNGLGGAGGAATFKAGTLIAPSITLTKQANGGVFVFAVDTLTVDRDTTIVVDGTVAADTVIATVDVIAGKTLTIDNTNGALTITNLNIVGGGNVVIEDPANLTVTTITPPGVPTVALSAPTGTSVPLSTTNLVLAFNIPVTMQSGASVNIYDGPAAYTYTTMPGTKAATSMTIPFSAFTPALTLANGKIYRVSVTDGAFKTFPAGSGNQAGTAGSFTTVTADPGPNPATPLSTSLTTLNGTLSGISASTPTTAPTGALTIIKDKEKFLSATPITATTGATFSGTKAPRLALNTGNSLALPQSFTVSVPVGFSTTGNVLVLKLTIRVDGLSGFEGWKSLTGDQKAALLDSLNMTLVYEYPSAWATLVGKGGVLSWADAVKANIVSFTDMGLVFSYATFDSGGKAPYAAANLMAIPDGTSDGKIVDPVWFLKGAVVPTKIELSPSPLTLKKGESAAVKVTFTPADATERDVLWTVGDTSVVSVTKASSADTWTVKGLSESMSTLTATASADKGVKKELSVSVLPVESDLIESLTVSPVPPYHPGDEVEVLVKLKRATASVTATIQRPDGKTATPTMKIDGTSAWTSYMLSKSGTYVVTVKATDAATGTPWTKTATLTVTEDSVKGGGSSGGCNTGFGLLALALSMRLLKRR